MRYAPHLPLPSRRRFLQTAGSGFGALALASLLHEQSAGQERARAPHFAPKVRSVIWLFMNGGPSHVDLFDYKPELQRRNGQQLAGADLKTGFFTTSGKCLRSPFAWGQHGASGSWVSELLPHTARHVDDLAFLHSCYSLQNNHAPAAIELMTGVNRPGYPSMGSWLNYGLGTMNANLPAFVVMHETKRAATTTSGPRVSAQEPSTADAGCASERGNRQPRPRFQHERRAATSAARFAARTQSRTSARSHAAGGLGGTHPVV